MHLSRRGDDLDDAGSHVENRDVKGATAEVEHHHAAILLLAQREAERRRLGLAQESHLDDGRATGHVVADSGCRPFGPEGQIGKASRALMAHV